MKILLVKPPLAETSAFILEPPLGLMYLSGFLKSHGYGSVKIIHMDAEKTTFDDLKKYIQEERPDVIGLSALTAEAKGMHEVAALTKELSPETIVIAGGPHPTAYPEDSLENGHVDIVVRGEGEEAFLAIMQNLGEKAAYHRIPGISFLSDGHILTTPKPSYRQDLDSFPYPDWDAIPWEKYKNARRMARVIYRENAAPVFTSRGCPFHCTYCHNIFGKKFRAHSSQRVLEEFKALHDKFGIRNFEIMDDIFNFDRQRAADIMQGIIDSGLKIKLYFPNGVRGDMLDDELLDLFAKAGVVFMSLAVETASPRLQKEIKKNVDLAKIKKVIAAAAKRKIFVNGFFMLGFPQETLGEMLKTVLFVLTSRLHTAYLFLVHPFEGTALGDWLKKNNKKTLIRQHSSNFAMISYHSANCSRFSRIQLKIIFNLTYLLFYLNPLRWGRVIRTLPNKKVLPEMLYYFFAYIFLNKTFDKSSFMKKLKTSRTK